VTRRAPASAKGDGVDARDLGVAAGAARQQCDTESVGDERLDGAGVVGDVPGPRFETGGAAEAFGGGSAAHASHDPRQVGNIIEVLDLPGTVPAFGNEQVEVVGAEVDGDVSGELGRGFVFVMEEEGDVDVTVIEQAQRFGRFGLGDFVRVVKRRVGTCAGVCLEPAECCGQVGR
jgi:hypothetical protein